MWPDSSFDIPIQPLRIPSRVLGKKFVKSVSELSLRKSARVLADVYYCSKADRVRKSIRYLGKSNSLVRVRGDVV